MSLELIELFLISSEIQIENNIKEIENKIDLNVDEISNEEYSCQESYLNLDSSTWNIRDVIKFDLPNLQRKSILISTLGFFEKEINKFCEELKQINGCKILLKDLKEQGVFRAFLYLEKVVGIPIDISEKKINELKNINKIRNLIVHNNGCLYDNESKLKNEESRLIKNNKYLSGEYEIQISKGYVESVIETYVDLFKHIDNLARIHITNNP